MNWTRGEIQYEGLPLLLRRPDYDNIWQYKEIFTQLIRVEHLLDKVTSEGLPEKIYNQALSGFDHYMCGLFDNNSNGIIFLIETYAGKRNYWYYTTPQYDIAKLIDRAAVDFNLKLAVKTKDDKNWGFFKAYPVQLFKP